MFGEIVVKKDDLLMAAILNAFDNMTEYHEENRIYSRRCAFLAQ